MRMAITDKSMPTLRFWALTVGLLVFLPNNSWGISNDENYPALGHWQRIIFDPAECSRDPQGMTYIAVGNTVLRHPSYSTYMTEDPDRVAPNTPPKPSDPAGCPDNPVQVSQYWLGFKNTYSDRDYKVYASLTLDDKKYEYSFDNEELFDGFRTTHLQDAKLILNDDSIPDFIGFKNASCINDAVFQSEHYLTPSGRRFTLSCSNLRDLCEKGYKDCTASYIVDDEIKLFYGFDVHELPLPKVIAFDHEVRRALAQEAINDYPWVAPTTK